jgi:DNA anti-recombination protein RmuC
MDSSATISPTDPREVSPGLSTQDAELVARADQRLAHAYEQIALADEQLARVNEQISKLENEGARKNSSRRSSRGRPALRGFIGLLLTTGICTAAFAWHSYGETVRPMIAQWAPQLAAASSLPLETPKLAADTPRVVQVAAVDAAISQLPSSAQTAAQDAGNPIPPETTQLLQTMAHDLANMRQEIEQLKAGQEALTRETAGNAQQLKETQEQTARAIAAVSEQNLRRASVAPPLPAANPARKPVSALAPTEARAQARPPVRLQPRQQ